MRLRDLCTRFTNAIKTLTRDECTEAAIQLGDLADDVNAKYMEFLDMLVSKTSQKRDPNDLPDNVRQFTKKSEPDMWTPYDAEIDAFFEEADTVAQAGIKTLGETLRVRFIQELRTPVLFIPEQKKVKSFDDQTPLRDVFSE